MVRMESSYFLGVAAKHEMLVIEKPSLCMNSRQTGKIKCHLVGCRSAGMLYGLLVVEILTEHT